MPPRKKTRGGASGSAAQAHEEAAADLTDDLMEGPEGGAPPPGEAAAAPGGRRRANGGGRSKEQAPPPLQASVIGAGQAGGAAAGGGHHHGSHLMERVGSLGSPSPLPQQPPPPVAGLKRGRGGRGAAAAAAAGPAANGAPPAGALAGAGSLEPGEALFSMESLMEAVVKVFCVHCEPHYSLPWQRKRQYSSSSTGFIIEGNKILTNAHCVDHHTSVKVKRRGSDTKYVATVVSVGAECDMAMLTVEDKSFFEGVTPVVFARDLPALQDPVTVVGYPIGGDTMSVTSGVVSRIEVTSYVHGAAELLGIQIDAAINSGNSGGPAFNERGECCGVAFQSFKGDTGDAENIGYIIPTPVVRHFISDVDRNGRYTGFPALGIEWQKLENPDLRSAFRMAASQKGVMVRRVEPTSAASEVLTQYDIITSFDGIPIANDGTVPFRTGERISFSYLVSQKFVGEEAVIEVLKSGTPKPGTAAAAAGAGAGASTDGAAGVGPSSSAVAGAAASGGKASAGRGRAGARGAKATAAAAKEEGAGSQGAQHGTIVSAGGEGGAPPVVQTLRVKLRAPTRLIPFHLSNKPPSYFIVAGLVFTPVTVPYLRSEYGKEYDFEAPVKLLDKMVHAMAETVDQQVVVLGHVLAAEVNIGYEDIMNTQVVSLNGTPISNLRHLVRLVDTCPSPWLEFQLEYNQKVVLSTQKARAATKEILATHCIAQDRSPDLVNL